MVTAAKSKASALQTTGMTLLTFAFLGQLVSHVYSFWIAGGVDRFVSALLRLAIVTAIPLAALTNWDAAGNLVPTFFTDTVSAAMGGGDGATAQIEKLQAVFTRIAKAFETRSEAVLGDPPTAEALPGMTAEQSMMSAASVGGSNLSMAGLLGINIDLKSFLTTVVASVILGIGCVVLLVAYALALYGNLIVLYLGVAFGPIFIALFPLHGLSYLARSWLNFMIGSGLTYAIATALVAIANAGLEIVIARVTSPPSNGTSSDFSTAVDVALVGLALMLFMAWLVTKADDIARAMLSGGSGGDGGGFLGLAVRTVRQATGSKPSSKH